MLKNRPIYCFYRLVKNYFYFQLKILFSFENGGNSANVDAIVSHFTVPSKDSTHRITFFLKSQISSAGLRGVNLLIPNFISPNALPSNYPKIFPKLLQGLGDFFLGWEGQFFLFQSELGLMSHKFRGWINSNSTW